MHDESIHRRSVIVRSVWAACLLIAGANHARILLQHGLWWDYHGAGWASASYWSSLTIVDPLVAAALFIRPKVGIAGTVLLIVTNVIHNLFMTARYVPEGEFLSGVAANPFVIAQIGFTLFVAATARMAWRGVAKNPTGRGDPDADAA